MKRGLPSFVFSFAGQQLRADDSSSVSTASMAPSTVEALSESGYFAESDVGSQPLSVSTESVIGGERHFPFQLALCTHTHTILPMAIYTQDEPRHVAMH